MSVRVSRGWNFVIALLVGAGIVVQTWIAVRVSGTPKAHATGTLAGTPLANRMVRVFSFFTIQSNLLSGVTSAQLFLNPNRDGRIWRAVRLAALLGITVTGIVYSTVLAKIHEPHGWKETSTNTAFHYVVPTMMAVGWLLFGPRPRIERPTILRALLWPVAWIGYILVYGRITKWHPYPFVDAATHGYGRVIINVFAVVLVLFVVTSIYWLGDSRLPLLGRSSQRSDEAPASSRP